MTNRVHRCAIAVAATGGVTYASAHEAPVDEDVHARLEEIRLGLASGDVDVAADAAAGGGG